MAYTGAVLKCLLEVFSSIRKLVLNSKFVLE